MPIVTLQQALAAGTQFQKAGRLDEAQRVYRQLLAQDPNCPDALHLLAFSSSSAGSTSRQSI